MRARTVSLPVVFLLVVFASLSRKFLHRDPTHGLDEQIRQTDPGDEKKQPLSAPE